MSGRPLVRDRNKDDEKKSSNKNICGKHKTKVDSDHCV